MYISMLSIFWRGWADSDRYVVAMDIPMIGRMAGRALEQCFHGGLQEFAKAVVECFEFTSLSDKNSDML